MHKKFKVNRIKIKIGHMIKLHHWFFKDIYFYQYIIWSRYFTEGNKSTGSAKSGSVVGGMDRQKSVGAIKGQLKLSIEYRKDILHVMICHAKDLAIPDGSKDEPNSYVKVYLRPDPHKATKRKTRVVRKNRHPSFMEMVSSH